MGRARFGAETGLDVGHVGEDQQGVGTELPGQQRGGQVLVDDRLDAVEAAVRPAAHRDPAAARHR